MSTPITLAGRVGRAPELKFSQGGQPIASFSVAVTERKRSADGTWSDGETTWWACSAFGSVAENICESIGKGDPVLIIGKARERSWVAEDGQKRSRMEVVVDHAGPDLRWCSAKVHRAQRSTATPAAQPAAAVAAGNGWEF